MKLEPWYKVTPPRSDLRDGKPLDASEFAVHLDQVRDGRAPEDYQDPERFFERTYLTTNLIDLAAQVTRRLSGITVETSAVFNFATQFGGGKTHALTLLYHLARGGAQANGWRGVDTILDRAQVTTVPEAATAVFVGTEFDVIRGRGGDDGTPLRRTPWGEIAWQLGGAESFAVVAKHDAQGDAPGGDVIRAMLPKRPVLILMDELVNFMSRNRKNGMTNQLYYFLQNLSETVRGSGNVVLAVSLPSLIDEMTTEDHADYERYKKMLDRLGKAVLLSAETETAEIIRRRLFEWDTLPEEGGKTCAAYADWVRANRSQIGDFGGDNVQDRFEACYPFHPTLLSVFERKWQSLPRFQKTRGMLRLLALWVSKVYIESREQETKHLRAGEPLIGLGTAPLDDALFRAALFEQLGSNELEGAVTTDIAGKTDAHAVRLDGASVTTIKEAALHQRCATIILFESNGGLVKSVAATEPEIRLAVGEPGLDIGNVETVLEALADRCYYLRQENKRYWFSKSSNPNKELADRQATIPQSEIKDRVLQAVRKEFGEEKAEPEIVFFPARTDDIPDRPALLLVVCDLEQPCDEPNTRLWVETVIKVKGTTTRLYKSAVLFAVPDNAALLMDVARKLLAFDAIQHDAATLERFDPSDKHLLDVNHEKAKRDLRESIWRTYRRVWLLGKDNLVREVDLGMVHSSTTTKLREHIVGQLRLSSDITESISPGFLVRHWPPALTEWPTKSVCDAFFASPQFPRLLNRRTLAETIRQGVASGVIAYVDKKPDGDYRSIAYCQELTLAEIELDSAETYLITQETLEAYEKAKAVSVETVSDSGGNYTPITPDPPQPIQGTPDGLSSVIPPVVTLPQTPLAAGSKKLIWSGDVPWQKWMNFYKQVLSKYATGSDLKLTIRVEVLQEDGISTQKVEETRQALHELGLNEQIEIS